MDAGKILEDLVDSSIKGILGTIEILNPQNNKESFPDYGEDIINTFRERGFIESAGSYLGEHYCKATEEGNEFYELVTQTDLYKKLSGL